MFPPIRRMDWPIGPAKHHSSASAPLSRHPRRPHATSADASAMEMRRMPNSYGVASRQTELGRGWRRSGDHPTLSLRDTLALVAVDRPRPLAGGAQDRRWLTLRTIRLRRLRAHRDLAREGCTILNRDPGARDLALDAGAATNVQRVVRVDVAGDRPEV